MVTGRVPAVKSSSLLDMNEFPVQLRTTLSHAAPDKAAQIRSAVTGALQHGRNGMFCFERSVETSFVLPWDLNPRVEPQRLSRQVRDGIRGELMDEQALAHLEQSGSVNWNGTVMWQYRSPQGGPWHGVEELSAAAAGELEAGYAAAGNEYSFTTFTTQFQVNYLSHRLACVSATSTLYEIRRLAFAPLMPMKVRGRVVLVTSDRPMITYSSDGGGHLLLVSCSISGFLGSA